MATYAIAFPAAVKFEADIDFFGALDGLVARRWLSGLVTLPWEAYRASSRKLLAPVILLTSLHILKLPHAPQAADSPQLRPLPFGLTVSPSTSWRVFPPAHCSLDGEPIDSGLMDRDSETGSEVCVGRTIEFGSRIFSATFLTSGPRRSRGIFRSPLWVAWMPNHLES